MFTNIPTMYNMEVVIIVSRSSVGSLFRLYQHRIHIHRYIPTYTQIHIHRYTLAEQGPGPRRKNAKVCYYWYIYRFPENVQNSAITASNIKPWERLLLFSLGIVMIKIMNISGTLE